MGQVLAVISGKGGTGKTSVCAGVAGCLCMEGSRVLCIDADLGLRNLDISLGMASEASVCFLDVIRGDYTLEQAPRAAGLPGLQLLTAPAFVRPDELDAEAFGRLLSEAKERFDWVLIDAPAGIGAGFDLAVRFADELMVVCLADPASQRDAAAAAEIALKKLPVFVPEDKVGRAQVHALCGFAAVADEMAVAVRQIFDHLIDRRIHVIADAAAGDVVVYNVDQFLFVKIMQHDLRVVSHELAHAENHVFQQFQPFFLRHIRIPFQSRF